MKAAVFDVDGVLVEPMVFSRRLDEVGIDRERVAPFFAGPFKECVLGRAELRPSLAPHLAAWGWTGTVDELITLWFESDANLDTALLNFVDELRASGIGCYLGSTQEAERAAYLEGPMGLGEHFDGAFFSCRLGVAKPDPAFYAAATKGIGVKPDEILFLDDLAANVEAARAFGWRAEQHIFGQDTRPSIDRHR